MCIAVSFDLDELQSIPQLVKQLIDNYGQVDILVNNAGINLKKEFTRVTDEEFLQVLQTNVFSLDRVGFTASG